MWGEERERGPAGDPVPCANALATFHVRDALAHDRPYLLSQLRHTCKQLRIPVGLGVEGLQLLTARRNGAPLLHLYCGQLLKSLLRADQLLHPVLRVSQ